MTEKAPWDTTNEVAPWASIQQDRAPWEASEEGGAQAPLSTPTGEGPTLAESAERGLRRLRQTGLGVTGGIMGAPDSSATLDPSISGALQETLGVTGEAPTLTQQVVREQQKIEAIPQHPTMADVVTAAEEAPDIWSAMPAAAKAVWDSPDTLGFLVSQGVELAPQMVTMGGGVGAASRALAPVLTGMKRSVASMAAGGGISSIANTYGSNYAEALQKGMTEDQAQARASLQSLAQGGVDALTSGVVPWKIGGNQIVNIPAQTFLQMMGGMAGEYARSKVVGETPSQADVAVEGLLEMIGLPGDVAVSLWQKARGTEAGAETPPWEVAGEGETPPLEEVPIETPPVEGIQVEEFQQPAVTPEETALEQELSTLNLSLEKAGLQAGVVEADPTSAVAPERQFDTMDISDKAGYLESKYQDFEVTAGARPEAASPLFQDVLAVSRPGDAIAVGFPADDVRTGYQGAEVRQFAVDSVQKWLKAFAPDERIIISDTDSWLQAFPEEQSRGRPWGAMRTSLRNGGTATVIHLNAERMMRQAGGGKMNLQAKQRMYETLAHEFGHFIPAKHFDKAKPEVKNAIYQEYQNWRRAREELSGTESIAQAFARIYTPQKYQTHMEQYNRAEQASTFDYQDPNYTLSFDEFIADMVSRHVVASRDLDPPVRNWLKSLVAELKRFFSTPESRKFLPFPKVDDWLNTLKIENRLAELRKQAIMDSTLVENLASEDEQAVRYGLNQIDKVLDGKTGLRSQAFDETGEVPAPGHLVEKIRERQREGRPMGPRVTAGEPTGDFMRQAGEDVFDPGFEAEGVFLKKQAGEEDELLPSPSAVPPADTDPPVKSGALKGQSHPSRTIARFNRLLKWGATMEQIAWENMDVPGVAKYLKGVQDWWADKSRLTALAESRLKTELMKMKGKELENFAHYVHEVTILSDEKERKLTQEEKLKIAEKYPLTERAQQAVDNTAKDFQVLLTELFDVLKADLPRRFKHLKEPERTMQIAEEEATLDKEYKDLLNRDYWPLSRFGKYWTQVETTVDTRFQGRDFKAGSVILFETFNTEEEQKARHAQLKRAYGEKANVGGGMFSDSVMSFVGMPPSVIARVKRMISGQAETEEMAKLRTAIAQEQDLEKRKILEDELEALTSQVSKKVQEQLTGFDQMLHQMAPGQSFKHRLQRRKGTPGYSLDAVRGYANYMQSAANHLSRIKHYGTLMDAIGELNQHKKAVSVTGIANKEAMLEDYLREHYEYAMNPGEEFANLRALGFLWYLGGVPKSAFINLTQLPLFTGPVLASEYGDVKAMKELGGITRDFIKKHMLKGDPFEPDLDAFLGWAREQGFVDESLATELAALAEGSNLQRLMPGSFLKSDAAASRIRQASSYGAYLFQQAEKVNRYVTAIAAYRLERDKQLSDLGLKNIDEVVDEDQRKQIMDAASEKARNIVDRTQFEYARWNRPKMMRGKASPFFLFKMYQQGVLYYLLRDPSSWGKLRMLLAMGVLAGASGLPGAEDLDDLLKVLSHWGGKLTGKEDMYQQAKNDALRMVKDMGREPDSLTYGLSRDMFGLWDLSGSLSLGRQVPGVDPLGKMMTGTATWKEMMPQMMEEIGGPIVGIPSRFISAMSSDSPDTWREWEKASPKLFAGMSKASRLWWRGHDSNYAGQPLATEFDPNDMWHNIELVGQAAGFPVSRLAKETDIDWAQREAVAYWSSRREWLMKQFSYEKVNGNRETAADIKTAIRRFNREVPDRTLRISGESLRQSVRRRRKSGRATLRGRPVGRQGREIYRDVEEIWTEKSP